ncbi:MAG: hypothetical protein ACRDF4_02920 [Rhabdochlamydiaceae bacterium]
MAAPQPILSLSNLYPTNPAYRQPIKSERAEPCYQQGQPSKGTLPMSASAVLNLRPKVKLPVVALRSIPAPRSIRQEAWVKLISIEPACESLLEHAKAVYRELKSDYGHNIVPYQRLLSIFYDTFKPSVYRLAGHGARNPALRSSAQYDLLYEKICSALNIDCARENPLDALQELRAILNEGME